MAGTVLVYDDIQYHWHLSKTAYSESDCVAQSLAEALELEVETCQERLERAAGLLDHDTSQGYTCCVQVKPSRAEPCPKGRAVPSRARRAEPCRAVPDGPSRAEPCPKGRAVPSRARGGQGPASSTCNDWAGG